LAACLQIENRAYWSRAFRKLHIEVATRQDGLQVGAMQLLQFLLKHADALCLTAPVSTSGLQPA
jgi:hypothetical protein